MQVYLQLLFSRSIDTNLRLVSYVFMTYRHRIIDLIFSIRRRKLRSGISIKQIRDDGLGDDRQANFRSIIAPSEQR